MAKRIFHRILIVISILLFASMLLRYTPNLFQAVKYPVAALEEWTDVTQNNRPITLPHALQWDATGSSVLRTTLPKTLSDDAYLCFWTYFCSVEARVDGQVIVQQENANADSFGEGPTSRWNVIKLPADAAGKEITLQVRAHYTDTKGRLTHVVCGDLHAVHYWIEAKYALFCFLDRFLFWIGILFIVLAFIIKVDRHYKNYQIYAGIFAVLFSIYLSTATKTVSLDWISPFTKDFLCYFSLFSLSIPLTLFVRERVWRQRWAKIWCEVLAFMAFITLLFGFALHIFKIVDIHYTLICGLVLLMVAMLTHVYFTISRFRKERTAIRLLSVISSLLLPAILVVEYLQFYRFGTLGFDTGFISRMGALLVVAAEAFLYLYRLRQERKRQEQLKEEHRNLQLQMLTDQIRPHFILNTIGAIRTIIDEDPRRARDLLYDFSKYIRKNLEQKDYSRPIPFLEELDHINTFLKLEQARFGDAVKIQYDIQDKDFRILPLTVQPFVENAIKHGQLTMKEDGWLRISTRKIGQSHVIEIADNGVGFDAYNVEKSLENKKSVGMRSAILRLENEMNATVSFHSGFGGTQVRIDIPDKEKK